MTEASRVQKLLIEQNAEIDRIKARNKKLEAENKKFKIAMFEIIDLCRYGSRREPVFRSEPEGYCTCVKAFDALDYDLSNMHQIG